MTAASRAPVWEARIVLAVGDVLTENQRLHHYARNARVQSIRTVAHQTAVVTRAPRLERARLDVEVAFPDRRRRDTHNLMPTAKAVVDGLVDARLLPDDDRRHLTGPLLEAADDPSPRAWGRRTFTFRIAVTDLEPSSTIPATANATETEGETA